MLPAHPPDLAVESTLSRATRLGARWGQITLGSGPGVPSMPASAAAAAGLFAESGLNGRVRPVVAAVFIRGSARGVAVPGDACQGGERGG